MIYLTREAQKKPSIVVVKDMTYSRTSYLLQGTQMILTLLPAEYSTHSCFLRS